MRDQSSATTAATTVNVLDFLNDENAEITLEKLVKAVAKSKYHLLSTSPLVDEYYNPCLLPTTTQLT